MNTLAPRNSRRGEMVARYRVALQERYSVGVSFRIVALVLVLVCVTYIEYFYKKRCFSATYEARDDNAQGQTACAIAVNIP